MIRRVARVLLLDENDRLLLFRMRLPGARAGEEHVFWLPPGGGVEPGETHEQAALRELAEEAGLVQVELGPHVWNRQHLLRTGAGELDAREAWYLARCRSFTLEGAGWTSAEHETITEHRWWSVAELADTDEALTPSNLAYLLAELLSAGPPSRPLDVPV